MAKKPRLHRCSRCGNVAVWLWMPFSDTPRRRFFCDDCVPRTCRYCIDLSVHEDGDPLTDARVKWRGTDDELHDERQEGCDIYCYVDEKGRPDPCCEYMYCNEGFEHEHPRYVIGFAEVREFLNIVIRKEKYKDVHSVIEEILNKFDARVGNGKEESDDYREVIGWFKRECEFYLTVRRRDYDRLLIESFFTYLKQTLYGLRKKVQLDFENDTETKI